MKIISARITNFKSHVDTGDIAFGRRYTVVVGQNNSGKTALLDALNPSTFTAAPHRIPQRTQYPPIPNPVSTLEYVVATTGPELEHALMANGGQHHIPIPPGNTSKADRGFVTELFRQGDVRFKIKRGSNTAWESQFPSHGQFSFDAERKSYRIDINQDHQGWRNTGLTQDDSLPAFIGQLLQRSYYSFRAERMNIGNSRINESAALSTNASNLPSALLQLPASHRAHAKYIEYIREIFPNIYSVGARPVSADTAAIEIVMNDIQDGAAQSGITVPLAEAGTGVGQVLAILYVAVTADSPRVIAIDEPNSFLHPGAAKKLLSILKNFDHQYIITTHSPELIKIADPEYVHLIEWRGTESSVQTLDQKNLQDQRRLLSDLGVSLSDIFGADQILWVEGPTEERCFPLLLDHLDLASPTLSIASVIATDDLAGNRPRAKLAWEVYEKLSMGNALLAPALAFVLDREERSGKELADLDRAARGKIKFLPRRTYENYLIDPDAITALITQVTGIAPSFSVSDWIDQNKGDRKYLSRPLSEVDRWEVIVDAPKLLHDLFNEMSDAKVEYRKTTHSAMLTEWLLANKPDHLFELLGFIKAIVSP